MCSVVCVCVLSVGEEAHRVKSYPVLMSVQDPLARVVLTILWSKWIVVNIHLHLCLF